MQLPLNVLCHCTVRCTLQVLSPATRTAINAATTQCALPLHRPLYPTSTVSCYTHSSQCSYHSMCSATAPSAVPYKHCLLLHAQQSMQLPLNVLCHFQPITNNTLFLLRTASHSTAVTPSVAILTLRHQSQSAVNLLFTE
jgi:hypothetical protein